MLRTTPVAAMWVHGVLNGEQTERHTIKAYASNSSGLPRIEQVPWVHSGLCMVLVCAIHVPSFADP